jgi:N-sulfoglucosamine sulfohydrolase
MLTRRSVLQSSLAAGTAPLFAQQRPKNILLMIADDLGLHTGEYGDGQAMTPHLDTLARDGVRFTNAFCTTASCSASRSVMLSGLQNHTNGHYGHAHGEHNLRYQPRIEPVPQLLRNAGYRTGIVGKLHVNPLSEFPWDLHSEGNGRDVQSMAGRARKFISAAGDKPWYLHMGFMDPHRAGGGKSYANKDYPGVKRNIFDPAKLKVPSFLPDNQMTREDVAEYYEAANRLDQGIGMMMNLLRETNQLNNTLVVFISDNGMPFPNAKTNCYDAGMRLPCIVRAPGQAKRGLVNQALVNWTDLASTFLDWSGAKGPNYQLHGRSWLPILEQENPAGWDESYFSHTFHEITMYYPMRGVRTRQYKYIRNLFPELEFPFASDLWASYTWQSLLKEGERGKVGSRPVGRYLHRDREELYDIIKDRDELDNLAGRASHQAVLKDLRRKTHEYRTKTGDPWMILNNYKPEEI